MAPHRFTTTRPGAPCSFMFASNPCHPVPYRFIAPSLPLPGVLFYSGSILSPCSLSFSLSFFPGLFHMSLFLSPFIQKKLFQPAFSLGPFFARVGLPTRLVLSYVFCFLFLLLHLLIFLTVHFFPGARASAPGFPTYPGFCSPFLVREDIFCSLFKFPAAFPLSFPLFHFVILPRSTALSSPHTRLSPVAVSRHPGPRLFPER